MPLPPGVCEVWDPTWTCKLPTSAYSVSGVAAQAATEVLYSLSGRQFGLCTRIVRPCRIDCLENLYGSPLWFDIRGGGGGTYPLPALIGGRWYNLICWNCGDGCSCKEISEARLPGPVYDVTTVKVDGVELTAGTDYRVDDWRKLVRLGGEVWPLCNDITLADTEVGTWSVTYRQGTPVPPLGQMAVAELATEFAKLLACDDSCALPKPVQSIARQGVQVTFLDPNEIFADGRTGLYLSDLFIQTYNPAKLRRRSRAYDVDGVTGNRRHIGTS